MTSVPSTPDAFGRQAMPLAGAWQRSVLGALIIAAAGHRCLSSVIARRIHYRRCTVHLRRTAGYLVRRFGSNVVHQPTGRLLAADLHHVLAGMAAVGRRSARLSRHKSDPARRHRTFAVACFAATVDPRRVSGRAAVRHPSDQRASGGLDCAAEGSIGGAVFRIVDFVVSTRRTAARCPTADTNGCAPAWAAGIG